MTERRVVAALKVVKRDLVKLAHCAAAAFSVA